MSLAKSRILLIATEAKARFKNALDSGRTVDVQSPAVLATLAKRGADLIVVDLSMGDQLLDYVEQLANFGEVPRPLPMKHCAAQPKPT